MRPGAAMRAIGRGLCVAALAGLPLAAVGAAPDAWPTRPLRLIVPYAPGGPTDIIGRLVARFAGEALGKPVVVDNRAGAGGTIGLSQALQAEPDGYTLALVAPGPIAGMPNLMKLPYAPDDIAYLTLAARTPSVIVVRSQSGIDSLAALIEQARRHPGTMNYGSAGAGTTPHLGAELFKQEAKVDLVHVPYKGAAPALAALMAGDVQMMMVDLLPVIPLAASGRLKILAIVSDRRVPSLPDVPTTRELGFPGVLMDANYGIVGPKGIPSDVQARIVDAVRRAVGRPEMQAEMGKIGGTALTSTSAGYRDMTRVEFERWKQVVDKGHLTLN
ncbi:Bug family tripartite tricarboxylate transporter substrate binding protein [Pigmentiphaga litoralis]|uniref:Bug family tripartite tricarboxylate transporter substrate binding protein n=1 Tax=Pigmentiphaga litoralis TaxID=516702 RepID=UPI001672EC2C|nr:tripartite tricarboxylate transporter substrate binding protein [Pigmentiphaga litoralis]